MGKFIIQNQMEIISSVNQTIRMKENVYNEIMELGEIYGLSFNKIINQCLEYALSNLDERYKK